MKLEFSKLTLPEVIASIDETKAADWQLDILEFLKNYTNAQSEIEINEMQGEGIFTVNMRKENIQKTVLALNDYIGIRAGDTTLLSNSIKMKDGVIALSQSIEGKMDVYCTEPTNVIKIPYTEQDQNTIHWGLNYIYLTESQVQQSSDVLHRIEKIAIETNGMTDETKGLFRPDQNQKYYEVFSVKSFPIGIRNIHENQFKVVGNVEISRSEQGLLRVNSPHFDEAVNTQKTIIMEDNYTFRWLTASEYLAEGSDKIISFDHIEDVLKPSIDTRFVVINFPDKSTGKDVVTLVVERRYMEEFTYDTHQLQPHEIPKQTFFLGEFPENNDRASIRKEIKRLLQQN